MNETPQIGHVKPLSSTPGATLKAITVAPISHFLLRCHVKERRNVIYFFK